MEEIKIKGKALYSTKGAAREYTAYIVQLPDEYLRRQLGSDRAGIVRIGLRSLSNVDRIKKQKPSDWTV